MTKANLTTGLTENKQLMKVNAKQIAYPDISKCYCEWRLEKNQKLNNNKILKSVGNDAVDEIKKLKKKSADVHMEITFLLNLLSY